MVYHAKHKITKKDYAVKTEEQRDGIARVLKHEAKTYLRIHGIEGQLVNIDSSIN